MEWISVKDGMPNDGVRVLSVQEDGMVRINMTACGAFKSIVNKSGKFVKTTHWAQLPKAPKN